VVLSAALDGLALTSFCVSACLCWKEYRHHRTHRTSRRVRLGGSGLWGIVGKLVPFNVAWPGSYVPPRLSPIDRTEYVDHVMALRLLPHDEFARHLLEVRDCFALTGVPVGVDIRFARFPSPVAPRFRDEYEDDWEPEPCGAPSTGSRRLPADVLAALALAPECAPSPGISHCIGCSVKCGVVQDGGDIGPGEPSGSGWLLRKFSEVMSALGLPGQVTVEAAYSPALAEPPVARAARSLSVTPARNAEPSIPVQHVWLGLCSVCAP
jgi:hypothetical protein